MMAPAARQAKPVSSSVRIIFERIESCHMLELRIRGHRAHVLRSHSASGTKVGRSAISVAFFGYFQNKKRFLCRAVVIKIALFSLRVRLDRLSTGPTRYRNNVIQRDNCLYGPLGRWAKEMSRPSTRRHRTPQRMARDSAGRHHKLAERSVGNASREMRRIPGSYQGTISLPYQD